MPGVWPLVRELGPHEPYGASKKKKKLLSVEKTLLLATHPNMTTTVTEHKMNDPEIPKVLRDEDKGKEMWYPGPVLGVLCIQASYCSTRWKCEHLNGLLDGTFSHYHDAFFSDSFHNKQITV